MLSGVLSIQFPLPTPCMATPFPAANVATTTGATEVRGVPRHASRREGKWGTEGDDSAGHQHVAALRAGDRVRAAYHAGVAAWQHLLGQVAV